MPRPQLPPAPLLLAAGLLLVSQAPASAAPAEPSVAPLQHAAPTARFPDPASPSCASEWAVDAAGVRRLPGHCVVTPSSAAPVGASALPADRCDPPWLIDGRGIQRLLPECLDVAKPPPMALQPASAPTVVATPACDPPWVTDESGIGRLRLECL